MIDNILYKTFTSATQISTQPCFLVGAEHSHSGSKTSEIFDEADDGQNIARKVIHLQGEMASVILPLPGMRCEGLYGKCVAGTTTVYYYYEK